LKHIDASTPEDLDLHSIVDNYTPHKHLKVQRWLARHPHFPMHFIPTRRSWPNLVERLVRDLTQQCILRAVLHSVKQLVAAIED
jgi:transposase